MPLKYSPEEVLWFEARPPTCTCHNGKSIYARRYLPMVLLNNHAYICLKCGLSVNFKAAKAQLHLISKTSKDWKRITAHV
jgi:hypothetical protein